MDRIRDLPIPMVGDAVSDPHERVREVAGPVAAFRDGYIGDISVCVPEFRIRDRGLVIGQIVDDPDKCDGTITEAVAVGRGLPS